MTKRLALKIAIGFYEYYRGDHSSTKNYCVIAMYNLAYCSSIVTGFANQSSYIFVRADIPIQRSCHTNALVDEF